MSPDSVWLVHDDTPYTPLSVDGDTWTYVLGSNGSNNIWLDGVLFARVILSGIVPPDDLPNTLSMSLHSGNMTPSEIERITLTSADCINFPHKTTRNYPNFRLRIGAASKPVTALREDFEVKGGSIFSFGQETNLVSVLFQPASADTPCYVEYKGYIVTVCNYSS